MKKFGLLFVGALALAILPATFMNQVIVQAYQLVQ